MIVKHKIILLAISLAGNILGSENLNGQTSAYFASHPTLSPDGKTLVFSYEGDLWKASIDGGAADRLTAFPGEEISPRISPDGKWLAFSSNQFGNYDVFVMPMQGGDIRQLTYHDAADEVDNWSWDSKTIYLTSNRYNRFGSYRVAIDGGTPVRLFPNYFNTTHQIAELPNGELLFSNSWESQSQASRKRYKGEFNPDVLSYHPKTKAFKQYTDWEGKDFWTSTDRQGKIYFVSDEGNDEYNLYTLEQGKKTALTQFQTSIKRPFVAANGEKIVFEKDYQIHVYDVVSKKTQLVPLQVYRNPVLTKETGFDVRDNISAFDISPDGKKMAFVARGELFVSDIDGKFVRHLPLDQERVFEVKWLSDNKTLLYNQTDQGYPNWFTLPADGNGTPKQLTKDLRSNRNIEFNPARTHAVYLSGRDEVRLLDLKTLGSKILVKDEIWGFQNSPPSFSPNGDYVLFTAVRNFEQDIFVHQLASGSTINLTNTGVTESNPVWSPDGKSIFYTSNPTKPSYPFGMQDASIYEMTLDHFDKPYRSEKFDELFASAEETKKEETVISINVKNLRNRVARVSPAFGTQYSPSVFRKANKTYLFFSSNHEGGKTAFFRLTRQDFEQDKTDKVTDGSLNGMVEVGGKFYALSRGSVQKYNLEANKLEKINLEHAFSRNLNREFQQMFYETWAGLEENFYEENFHGVDWVKVKENYARFLPYINNRNDLRTLLNDMLGELNSSHLGFSSSGKEEQKPFQFATSETGIIFNNDHPYQVERIVENSPAAKLGIDIHKGDLLVAVDGDRVDVKADRNLYFTKPKLVPELTLTFVRNGQEFSSTVRSQSSAALRDQIYDEWIMRNRTRTDSLSQDRIAYSHMKNMSGDELQRFLLDMVEQENNKDGIILDLRFNTGGNVHDEVLKFLSQRPYLQWQYRGGKRAPQSNFAPASKPIVLLINEQSLSDAEMTAAGFKALKLGTVIGTETYRWIIFTSAKSLVDGSNYRVPGWGCYTLDGDNLEHTGVAPDIYVKNTFLDRLTDQDPQLERAVQEILRKLK